MPAPKHQISQPHVNLYDEYPCFNTPWVIFSPHGCVQNDSHCTLLITSEKHAKCTPKEEQNQGWSKKNADLARKACSR